jgi:hypothetical protein
MGTIPSWIDFRCRGAERGADTTELSLRRCVGVVDEEEEVLGNGVEGVTRGRSCVLSDKL